MNAEQQVSPWPVGAAPSDRERWLAALVENAAEGIVTIDARGRFLSINAAGERILGVARTDLVGRPSADPPFRRFTLAGEPLGEIPTPAEVGASGNRIFHHEYLIERADGSRIAIARDVTALNADDGTPLGVISTFSDITERLRTEQALREREQRQAFLLALSDVLRPLTGPAAIQAAAARLLGEHLGANQVHYGEVLAGSGDEAIIVVHQGYSDGLPPSVGTVHHAAEEWGKRLLATYRAGRTSVCTNVSTDPTITAEEAAVIAGAGFQAYVVVPLVKAGAWVAVMAVHSVAPRAWTAGDVALIEEAAERTLAAVEQAHAEETLRINEVRMHWQKEAFQAAIDGAPLATALDLVARLVNAELAGEARVAFYLAGPTAPVLHPVWGAGDMPVSYLEQIDGCIIGADALAYALALPTGRPSLTRDVFEDPRWAPWTWLAERYDYRGRWSFPIKTRDDALVGAVALYFRTVREAGPRDLELAEVVTQTAAVIIASHAEAQERVRAEAALRDNEERMRRALSVPKVGVLFLDLAGHMHDANAAFQQMCGYSVEELRATAHWDQLTAPEFHGVIEHHARDLAEHGETPPYEKQMIHKDGTRWWGLFAPTRLGGMGPASECVEFVFDITDAKRAEAALRRSEEQLRVATSAARISTFQIDMATSLAEFDGNVLSVLYGTASHPSEAILREWGPLMQTWLLPEDARRHAGLLQATMRGEGDLSNELLVRNPDTGADAWIEAHASLMRDDTGRPSRVVGIMQNVTERKRTEEALRQSEARLRSVLEIGTVGMLYWDDAFRLSDMNAAFLTMTGFSREEALGMPWQELTPPEFHALSHAAIAQVAANGEAAPFEKQCYRKDGSRWWGLFTARRVGEVVVEFVVDITERKQFEEERERWLVAEAVAAERQAVLRQVVVVQEEERRYLAHEVHDSVTQLAHAAAMRLDDLTDRLANTLPAADMQDLARARELTRQAAVEARRLIAGLRPETLDDFGLARAVGQEVDALQSEGWRATLDAEGLGSERLPAEVEITLYRVAQEALTNVRKHTRPGVRVRVVLTGRKSDVRLEVRDWGSGFDPGTVQASAPGQRVGLTGMRERLALLGGELTVRSSAGRGTTIRAMAPLVETRDRGRT